MSLEFLLVALPAIFTIVNPMGAVGPYLAMTATDSAAKQLSTAKRSCWIALFVLFGCGALGQVIFQFLGITIPALKIAGGVLLFLVALDMINARQSRSKATDEDTAEGVAKDDVAIFPLAIPLLSGPGAIVTVFILVDRAKSFLEHSMIYLSIAITMFVSYLILSQASRVARLLGQIGMNVLSRLMGLVLAAIAVQFVLAGLSEALPGLKR